jgi:hypothetical protein
VCLGMRIPFLKGRIEKTKSTWTCYVETGVEGRQCENGNWLHVVRDRYRKKVLFLEGQN